MAKRDWDIVTSYIDKVGTSDKVVSFNKVQDSVRVKNQGNVDLIYTIGTKSGTLAPNASITVSENLSSFTVKAASGVCSFEVRATEAGTETEETATDVTSQINELTANLAQRATEIGTTNQRIDTLVIASGNANAEVDDAKVSTAKNKTYTTLRNRLEESERELNGFTGIKISSIIKNGYFSNGATDWLGDSGTVSASGGALVVTGNGSKTSVRGYQDLGKTMENVKLHVKAKIRATNPDIASMNILVRQGLTGTIIHNLLIQPVVLNQWYELDEVITITTLTASNVFFIAQANYATAGASSGKTHEVTDVSIVDLTADFGNGKEPTKQYVNSLLALFPSTQKFEGTLRVGSNLSRSLNDELKATKPLGQYIIYKTDNDYDVWFETRSGKWIVYEMYRNIDAAIQKDSWRISRVRITEITQANPLLGRTESNTIFLTSDNSQWEYALQPSGAPDFMGGYHGDELLQSVLFLVEGKPITLNSSINRKFERIEMVQHTILYDPQTPANKLADVFCRHVFTHEGVRVKFSVDWTASRAIQIAYAGMLPALRGATLSTKGRFLEKPTVYDISLAGHARPGAISDGVELWNDTNNVSMGVEFDDLEWFNGYAHTVPTRGMWISESALYNKVYPTRVLSTATPENVSAGDSWKASMLYRFDCRG